MIIDTRHESSTPRPDPGRAGTVDLIRQGLRDHGAGCHSHARDAEDDESPEVTCGPARIKILDQVVEGQEEVKGKGRAVEQAVRAKVGGDAEGGTGGDGQGISRPRGR